MIFDAKMDAHIQNDRTNSTRSKPPPPPTSSSTSTCPSPVPTSSSGQSLRKSVIKISSSTTTNGMVDSGIDSGNKDKSSSNIKMFRMNGEQQQQHHPRSSSSSSSATSGTTRVIPIYRSISSNVNDLIADLHQRHHLPSSTISSSSSNAPLLSPSATRLLQHFNCKSPFNRSINLTISSPTERSSSPFGSRTNHETRSFGIKPNIADHHHRCYSPSSSGYDSSSNMFDPSTPLSSTVTSPTHHHPPPPSPLASSHQQNHVTFPEYRFKEVRRTSSATRLVNPPPPLNNINNNNNNIKSQSSSRSTTPVNMKPPSKNKRYSLNDTGHADDPATMKESVLRTLDQVEKRVSFFREIAFEMSEEKNKLLDALDKICSTASTPNIFTEVDLQDIRAATDSLQYRLNGIEILIKPTRTANQIKAFEKASQYLDELNRIVVAKQNGKMEARKKCLMYLSSCSSDDLIGSNNIDERLGAIDECFQKTIIECSLEDQKMIKKNLKAFLAKI